MKKQREQEVQKRRLAWLDLTNRVEEKLQPIFEYEVTALKLVIENRLDVEVKEALHKNEVVLEFDYMEHKFMITMEKEFGYRKEVLDIGINFHHETFNTCKEKHEWIAQDILGNYYHWRLPKNVKERFPFTLQTNYVWLMKDSVNRRGEAIGSLVKYVNYKVSGKEVISLA